MNILRKRLVVLLALLAILVPFLAPSNAGAYSIAYLTNPSANTSINSRSQTRFAGVAGTLEMNTTVKMVVGTMAQPNYYSKVLNNVIDFTNGGQVCFFGSSPFPNSSGQCPTTTVTLPPGNYTVMISILDETGWSATAFYNVTVTTTITP